MKDYTQEEWDKAIDEMFSIKVPGFAATRKDEEWGWGEQKNITRKLFLKKEGDDVEIVLDIPAKSSSYGSFGGHVSFGTKLGRRTFDRHGVDDSFYLDLTAKAADLLAEIETQLKRVEESRARMAASVPVPGLPGGHTVTPERKAQVTDALKAGKTYSFTPAGFGTGYVLSVRRRDRWSKPAPKELAEFFGVTSIFLDTMDCD